MYASNGKSVIRANIPWYNALDVAGANQMKHLRTLVEARSFSKWISKSELILIGMEVKGEPIRLELATDNLF